MPLAPGLPYKFGLSLWNSIGGTIAVEGTMFVAAVALYANGTRARNNTGRYALAGFVVFFLLLYAAAFVAPPPSDMKPVIFVNLTAWLIPLWGVWIDRNRQPLF